MKHNILVDVSGRMETGDRKDAAIAFSNQGFESGIFVPGKVKLEANATLKYMGKVRRRRGMRVLVAGIYLLIEDYLEDIDNIAIDDELPGWGVNIRAQLLGLIHQSHPEFRNSQVQVKRIGEHTRADTLAALVRKKKITPYKKVAYRQLLTVLLRMKA